jgi:hypothetical protein
MQETIFSIKHFKAYQSLNISEKPTISDIRNCTPSIKHIFFAHFTLEKQPGELSVQRRAVTWTVRVKFPAGARYFSLLRSVQPSSGAHPASYAADTTASSFLGKVPQTSTYHGDSRIKHRDFTFYLPLPLSLPLRNDTLLVA